MLQLKATIYGIAVVFFLMPLLAIALVYLVPVGSYLYYDLSRDRMEYTPEAWSEALRTDRSQCLYMLGSLERKLRAGPHAVEELRELLGEDGSSRSGRWSFGQPFFCSLGIEDAWLLVEFDEAGSLTRFDLGCHP